MENLVNESRIESRKKTNVTSLIAFFSFYVLAIFLLIINSKPVSSSILPQEYFWLPRNLIYTLFANGLLCLFLLIFKNSGKTLVWCIYTIPLMILSLNIVVMGFIILENSTYHAEPLWFSFFLLTVIAIVFGLLLYKYRVNINVVTDIFGESMKGVDGVKFLVLVPIVNSLLLLIPMNVYYSAYVSVKHEDYSLSVMWITVTFILFLFFMDEFQKFLVAGVTTKCYFIRDKNNFGQPILETLNLLLKFHLGSVCYGAMIKFFRPFLRFMSYISKTLNLTNSTTIINITNWFDAHTVSNNAYVLISRDGLPYYESGKKLYILHSKDLINANKINNTKNTTIFIIKFFLWSVIATVQALIIEHNQNFQKWTESNVEVFITLVYIFCMVSIYIDYIEAITDTTIVAACLDIETNNGTTKPYYMSKSLEDFIRRLRLEDEPQVIISRMLSPPQFTEVPQTTIISTIYSPYQQSSQHSGNIVYLPDFSNQVRDELIPVQNYQPSAPQFD